MEWLTEILGFVVLTGPLAALVIWLPVSLLIAVKLGKRFQGAGVKFIGGLVIFGVAFLLPFADEIAGRVYFNYLCNSEGGSKIYKSVEVGREYFLLPGEIDMNTAGRLPAKGGELNMNKLKEKYSFITNSTKISSLFRIQKRVVIVKDNLSDEVMGENINFLYFRGWLINSTSPHVSGKSCPTREDNYFNRFYMGIFKPSIEK
ncbi:MAG: hypothetical protein OEW89_11755 [Gammaproteobacteria bacterium]|nr:hypothetical protein [Gammaproteobacteria bacterium]